ncbi:MAG: NACHT domain-containing protein [Limnospira sp. PMC 737.11]|uniref:NACHT domain-containing protein n=1 Tax=Limnospira sp. PMC 737.11 TaxID=2981095 RepID=UPI0028E0B632|nr:NACHT domain-containing protein [Limnospira sp. PMC 737.11]MDT9274392.1 NACHT domain-containing protein [Limnospira sp. PMC 737.11]
MTVAMAVARDILKLTIGGGCVLGSLAFPSLVATEGMVWGNILATALGNVAAGNTANAIDALIDAREGGVSLENQDLTKAVGKAIAAVITLAAKQQGGKTRQYLEKIAAQAKDNWVAIAQQELTKQRYPDLREAQLDQFLTPQEYQLTQQGNLTATEWGDIFIRLNMAACKGGGFPIPAEVRQQVAELLHTTFPKALRETLKEDFAKDGKAFAGLTLQLLTGMQAQLRQLQANQGGVNVEEFSQILQQFQELETQLRGSVSQQQAFFREISRDIESGFAEVCQRLGVMETTISDLLQTLEERLEELRQEVTEFRQEVRQGLEALHNQPGGRSLSKQEYRDRQNILTQMRTEVESRLTQSIHRAAIVNLGKEQQPQQVQRPWDMSVKVGEQRRVQLPPQTTILDVFDNPTISGKFLILGKPGGGKTTTLLELAEALLERAEGDSDAPIPVILELSSWQEVTKPKFLPFGEGEKYDPSIKEWVLSQLRGVSQDIGEQWLREKELVLLLDGLDELQPERQGKCVRAINQFLGSEFSPLHLVVCSRKEEYEVYEEMLHLNGAICLDDLTNEQIRDYFASVNLGEFWESIKGSEKIVDFIRQPLFLAVTSIAYEQIDVEEWRNCNTEERAIDYLLGVYRVKMLTKKTPSRWYSSNNVPTHLIAQNALNRLSKSMIKKQEKNFIVRNITLCLLDSDLQIEYVNQISAFLIFFALFLPIVALIKPELYVAISVFLAYLFFAFYWRGKTEDQRMNIIVFLFVSALCFLGVLSMIPMFFSTVEVGAVVIIIVTYVGMYLNHFLFYREDINLSFVSLKMWLDEGKGMCLFERKPLDYRIPADRDEMVRRNEEDQQWGCLMFGFFCFGFLAGIPIANNLIKTNNLILSIIAKFAVATFAGIFVMLAVLLSWWLIVIFLFLAYSILVEMYNLCRHFVLRLILGFSGIMPWNITRFLDYCTERLILQRVGNRYRFIHRLVQEHFANLEIQKE